MVNTHPKSLTVKILSLFVKLSLNIGVYYIRDCSDFLPIPMFNAFYFPIVYPGFYLYPVRSVQIDLSRNNGMSVLQKYIPIFIIELSRIHIIGFNDPNRKLCPLLILNKRRKMVFISKDGGVKRNSKALCNLCTSPNPNHKILC